MWSSTRTYLFKQGTSSWNTRSVRQPDEGERSFPRSHAYALLLAASKAEAAFTQLVVFGDSLSDAGNDLQDFGTPTSPYYNGRFSDGPVWVDQLATQMGLPDPVASELGGTNYAYGGAETGIGVDHHFGVIPNMGPQIDDYLGSHTPNGDELFVLLGGHNNFRNFETDASVPVADMVDHITALANAGATSFLVSTLMPLGELPESRGGPNEAALNRADGRLQHAVDHRRGRTAHDVGGDHLRVRHLRCRTGHAQQSRQLRADEHDRPGHSGWVALSDGLSLLG